MAAGVENPDMRTLLAALLFCLFALASLPASLHAQQTVPDSGRVEDTFHYVPPPAWKSVEIGDYYFRKKDYRGALSRYQEAAKDDPDYALAYLALGRVYEKLGKKRDALAAYRKYLDALPSRKQADEAIVAHKAIRRLEDQLRQEPKRSRAAPAPSSAAEK